MPSEPSGCTWTATSAWSSEKLSARAAPGKARTVAAAATRQPAKNRSDNGREADARTCAGFGLTSDPRAVPIFPRPEDPRSRISGGAGSKVDGRGLALCLVLDLEELPDGESERPGDDEAGEGLHRVVVREHGVVVDLPRDGHAVLGLGELGLELAEVLVRLQLGIRLGDGEEAAERRAQDALGLRGLRGRLGLLRAGARLRHVLEGLALVRCVALDRLDEVWDEVPAPLKLHLDLRPRVVDPVALLDEAVVEGDEQQPDDHDDRDDHDDPDHGRP